MNLLINSFFLLLGRILYTCIYKPNIDLDTCSVVKFEHHIYHPKKQVIRVLITAPNKASSKLGIAILKND